MRLGNVAEEVVTVFGSVKMQKEVLWSETGVAKERKKGRMYSIEIIRQISAVHLGRGEDGDSVVYLTTVYQILMVWGLRGSGFNADV